MTPHLLRTAGEALYGQQWQSALARALCVSDRTVRRWASGEFAIPATTAESLEPLLLIRVTQLAYLLPHISRECVASGVRQVSPVVNPDSPAVDQLSDPDRVA